VAVRTGPIACHYHGPAVGFPVAPDLIDSFLLGPVQIRAAAFRGIVALTSGGHRKLEREWLHHADASVAHVAVLADVSYQPSYLDTGFAGA
jgi:hypothetical protein